MRRMSVAAWCACIALLVATGAGGRTAAGGADTKELVAKDEIPVDVMAVSFDEFGESDAALGETLVGVLGARGVPARLVPPAAECAAPDAGGCLRAALGGLARGRLGVAVVPSGHVVPPPVLRDAGLEEVGEVAPPARRECRATDTATAGHVRSLLDLADPTQAATYALTTTELQAALVASNHSIQAIRYYCANGSVVSISSTCEDHADADYATVLTGTEGEARVVSEAVRAHGLRAHVVSLAAPPSLVAAALRRPALLCGRSLPAAAGRTLGPPPCLAGAAVCPFESRRLVKLVNVRLLAHAPSAVRALTRIQFDAGSMVALRARAHEAGPATAAREARAAHPAWGAAPAEVRVAVMVPIVTRRDAVDARALRAAAELAEVDASHDDNAQDRDKAAFKVELMDDGCTATRAFKYLTDALGSEFGALSGVFGPACGAAFGDVTRQSAALALPVLAYTAQPPSDGSEHTVLGAGDARRGTRSVAALAARLGWRRLALLSELDTRAALDAPALSPAAVDVIAHLELPAHDTDDAIDYDSITQDARAVRGALCAGKRAGLSPATGAVWLLPGALPVGWLRPAPADGHNCSRAELVAVAEGHLTVAPDWAVRWSADAGGAQQHERAAWVTRWMARCVGCAPPPPTAALLYDLLRLWAAALRRLLQTHPAAIDDLHQDDLVRSLIADVTSTNYTGLTGEFMWEGRARGASLVLQQWRNGTYVPVGSWREENGLVLVKGEPAWGGDGSVPEDGGERCGLRALADALHVECRVAFAAVGALVVAALLAALAGVAWHCRRRAEREFRERMIALDMRTLGPKFGGLDRWEVPRERVVINRKLGTGAFGTVYGGHALLPTSGPGRQHRSGASEDLAWAAVAVKTLKVGATTDEKLDFLSEAEAMKRFDHKNVVRLLGVVTKTEPVCTVMEYMLYGDLKSYLVARRHLAGSTCAGGAEVSPARLTAMALDVARALSYLAQLRYVHRDLAARNCLVSATRVVKLADFGMTRLTFENDYYRFSRKGMLPVRWMAPESLALGVFSPASDVWSFGVLLYEIVTFGSLPFQGLGNAEVLDRVKAGHTLDLPKGLKPQLEGLIKSCWQRERGARPKAAAVAAFLAESPRLLVPCLDLPLALDALPLEPATPSSDDPSRWLSWVTSAGTDSTYLSAEGARESDAFLPSSPAC